MIMVTYSAQNNWDLVQAGLDEDEEQWSRRWWKRARLGFKPDFVEAVETHMGSAGD
jgi:hypothetical protein